MKRAMVVILSVIMLLSLFAGCAGGSTETTKGTSVSATPVEITVLYLVPGSPKNKDKVEAEINKITIAKANVKVKLLATEVPNYAQQINMMIAGGEKLDTFGTFPDPAGHFATMLANKQIMDITDLVAKNAQDAVKAISDVNPGYLEGTKLNGRLYGLTCLFDKVASMYVSIRKDIADKYKFDVTQIKNAKDLENILTTIKNGEQISPFLMQWTNEGTMYNFDDFSKNTGYDPLGDSNSRYGVVIGDGTKVENLYATAWYKKGVELQRDWYQKGLIYKDAATTTEEPPTLVANNAVLGLSNSGESDYVSTIDDRTKYPMVNTSLGEGMIATDAIQKFTWVVSSTSKQPEAAVKFLNLTYTNTDLLTLFVYGIKGENWVDGKDGMVKYPDGVDASNTTYPSPGTYTIGNQFIQKLREPGPANLRQIALERNKTAKVSKMMGLSIDNSTFVNELTAVTSVCDQYRKALEFGSIDPAVYLPQFLSALDKAGMNTIIAESQKQVDAFLKTKK
jgi:putative aldouronate transport system substrate-binding protein